MDVRGQSGDRSLQPRGPCLPQEAPVCLPGWKRQHVYKVSLHPSGSVGAAVAEGFSGDGLCSRFSGRLPEFSGWTGAAGQGHWAAAQVGDIRPASPALGCRPRLVSSPLLTPPRLVKAPWALGTFRSLAVQGSGLWEFGVVWCGEGQLLCP